MRSRNEKLFMENVSAEKAGNYPGKSEQSPIWPGKCEPRKSLGSFKNEHHDTKIGALYDSGNRRWNNK